MIRSRQQEPVRGLAHVGAVAGAVALLAILLATPALAEREFNKTVKAEADGIVTVENIAGSVAIIGWDRDEVQVAGTLTGDVEDVIVDSGRKTAIKVKYPRNRKNSRASADLVIHVPAGSRVDVECISASVEISDVTGEVDAESISGEVTVKGPCAMVSAESISGSVTYEGKSPVVNLASVSGEIAASGGEAEVEAGTVSGSIRLEFAAYRELKVESVSGDAVVSGDLSASGRFNFELHSGDLTLTVPGDVDADFQVETFSGGIDNDFGQKSRKTSKYTPGRELEFSNGDGSARVRIDTFSGDVIIRKK